MRCPGIDYPVWRKGRIQAILEYYGAEFFRGKSILEVGCGDGSIGNFFYYLGAEVSCSDVRPTYMDEIFHRNSNIKTEQCDLNIEWPFQDEYFDIVLCMGVLYHLKRPDIAMCNVCRHANYLIIETQVRKDKNKQFELKRELPPNRKKGECEIDDHAYDGQGCRFSIDFIENILRQENMQFNMLPTKQAEQIKGFANNNNRMWFCEKRQGESDRN